MLVTMPTTEDSPKRKTTQLRIEPELLGDAAKLAKTKRMSLNSYICLAVENQVKADTASLASS